MGDTISLEDIQKVVKEVGESPIRNWVWPCKICKKEYYIRFSGPLEIANNPHNGFAENMHDLTLSSCEECNETSL